MATPLGLHIPSSTATVTVSIIDTGTTIRGIPCTTFVEPEIPGHEYLAAPCFSFLIQNVAQNRTLLFDLAITKNWQNWPAPLYERLVTFGGTQPVVPQDVRDVLDAHGFDATSIEGIIWSHTHVDHVGDVSRFPPQTKLIVGAGAKADVFPGYPTVPNASFNESEIAGHEVQELDFSGPLVIAGCAAVDYFGDGSLYLLDTPGHCVGHVCALARVTSGPDSFVLMGGDAVHHGGELRPHPWRPLPTSILPDPFGGASGVPCPGEIFDALLPDGREAPFYKPSRQPHSAHADVSTMAETIKRLQEADGHDNILIIPAHDPSFVNVVDMFPKALNSFMEKGWVQKTKWAWLASFAKAVGRDEEIPRRLFGDPRPVSVNK